MDKITLQQVAKQDETYQEWFDDYVYDLQLFRASALNNEGIESQAEAIVKYVGPDEFRKVFRENFGLEIELPEYPDPARVLTEDRDPYAYLTAIDPADALDLVLGYIGNQGSDEALADFLLERLEIEGQLEPGDYILRLRAPGNPDMRQFAPIAPQKDIVIGSIHEAPSLCRQYIGENELGLSNWGDGAGHILDHKGQMVARVAYNGRILYPSPEGSTMSREDAIAALGEILDLVKGQLQVPDSDWIQTIHVSARATFKLDGASILLDPTFGFDPFDPSLATRTFTCYIHGLNDESVERLEMPYSTPAAAAQAIVEILTNDRLPRLMATFQPQAWIKDYATEIDSSEEFDVTEKIVALDFEVFSNVETDSYESDDLADDLPARQNHHGPFYVDLDLSDWRDALEDKGYDPYSQEGWQAIQAAYQRQIIGGRHG